MNYLTIPFFVVLIAIFHKFQSHKIGYKKIRERFCFMWCITLLFSFLGAIISYNLYHYRLPQPISPGLVAIFALYLVLTAIFLAIGPSGYKMLLKQTKSSEEEFLYAEYHFNQTLVMLRSFFLTILFVVPMLYYIYVLLEETLEVPLHLEEPYLIGGLFFVSFCILFPMSVRQSIFWLGQLQKMPGEYESEIINKEYNFARYAKKNRRL